jgi:coenzyme F420-0:L-glutamate ligase/coenzyme F420-1:gamma-L-glutamate ligase
VRRVEVLAIEGLPEVHPGDDLAELIAERSELRDGDVVVVAQKIVSKAEGRIRRLDDVVATDEARAIAGRLIAEPDPRAVQVVLDESARVVRSERVLITESRHGFVSANAGVDHSNIPGEGALTLLPEDPDASAARLRDGLKRITGTTVGVIVSDTFGRPWRLGIVNVALGIASAPSVVDLRGGLDDNGKPLHATVLAVADDIAAAAGLVMGKTWRTPAVIVRGLEPGDRDGTGKDLIRPPAEDLFR